MVSMAENWCLLMGIVVGSVPTPPGERLAALEIRVERLEPYKQYPMLVHKSAGDTVVLRATSVQIGDAERLVHERISVLVRRGQNPDVVIAAPDWVAPGTDREAPPER